MLVLSGLLLTLYYSQDLLNRFTKSAKVIVMMRMRTKIIMLLRPMHG